MKRILVLAIIVLIGGGAIALYLWNKPHRDPTQEKAAHQLEAAALQQAFLTDIASAMETYLDQVVEVSGEITEAGPDYLVLNEGVYVRMATEQTDFPQSGKVLVKGRVVSFDDLFEQVRLDFATLQE